MYEFTIIIPVYNEEDNLERLEHELVDFLKIALKKTAVLFVNDGSEDNSQMKIHEICKKHKAFEYISFKKNYGLSAAIKAGFDHINTPLLGYMDSDLQTVPSDFNMLLTEIESYTLVTGVRSHRKDGLFKKMSSKVGNGVRRLFTNDGMDDTGCPLKVIRTAYAKKIPMFRGLHRFLPAMILLQNGTIKQIPVQHFPRIAGTTKFGAWDRLLGSLADCFAYLWMKRKYINYSLESKQC